MLTDNEFYEKKQSKVGRMESDWQGRTCSTSDRVIRKSLSVRNLKNVKEETMLKFGGEKYFRLTEQKVQNPEGGISLM